MSIKTTGPDGDLYFTGSGAGSSGDPHTPSHTLGAGTALVGKVGIDQATANANEVVVKSIAAGDNNIGNVDVLTMPTTVTKGVGFTIPVTLTVTNGAYTAADVVGGLITFANACSAAGKAAIINTVTLAGVVAIPYELWLFASDIATPAADNAAFALAAADAAMCKGVIPISAIDYNAAQTAFNVATVRNVGLQFNCTATTLYGYLKATATTSPGTTTLTLTIKGNFID